MTESERILQAMKAMDDFTVADLVQACDAHGATVRTVVQRHKDDLELLGIEETGRRGGRWKRYRLRPEAAAALVKRDEQARSSVRVPAALLAAEELLLDAETANADGPTRASLLRRARRFRSDAQSSAGQGTSEARAHARVVDLLITLTAAEGREDPGVLAEVRRELARARGIIAPLQGGERLTELERRIDQTPLNLLSATVRTDRLSEAVELVVDIAKQYVPLAARSAAFGMTRVYMPTGRSIAAHARSRNVQILGAPATKAAELSMIDVRGMSFGGSLPRPAALPASVRPPVRPIAHFGMSNQRVRTWGVLHQVQQQGRGVG